MAGEKKGRRAYLNDYIMNAAGEYVYTGSYMKFDNRPASLKKVLLRLWTLIGASAVGQIICGCIPVAGMDDCFYVILPYLFALASTVSVIWALCRITYGGDPLKKYVYDATVAKLPVRCFFAAAFSGTALIVEIVYIIINGFEGKHIFSFIFIGIYALSIVVVLLARRRILRLSWTEISKK